MKAHPFGSPNYIPPTRDIITIPCIFESEEGEHIDRPITIALTSDDDGTYIEVLDVDEGMKQWAEDWDSCVEDELHGRGDWRIKEITF